MILLTILVFILILGLLIFAHEVGHFVMAKRAGMKVLEFGFGFPPRLFGIKKGGTIYSINLIPLGGFVKILGEDGGETSDPKAFGNKGFGVRFLVLIAGVVMNFLLAWFLFFLGFWIVGTPTEVVPGLDLSRAKVSQSHITVVAVEQNSPAQQAGFKPGDVILSIDQISFENVAELISYTKSKAGSKVVYKLQRGKEVFFRDVVPRVNPREGSGPVGFAPAKIAQVSYPVWDALKLSVAAFFGKTLGILSAFGLLLKKLVGTGKLIESLSGPVGIAVLTRDFTRLGLVYLVQFTAVLSINLAIINGFPFPALDGGRVLFLLIESAIGGRGAKSVKAEQFANTLGFLLLLLLMVAVTFRDINRFSEQFKRLFERIF